MNIAVPLIAVLATLSSGSLAGASRRAELPVARPIERSVAQRIARPSDSRRELRRVVAARIAGVWGLDAATTGRLRPRKHALLEPRLVFVPDDRVARLVTTATLRLAALDVFASGLLRVGSSTLLYVIVDDGVALRVLVFDPAARDFYAHPASFAIGIAGEGSANERLYLGVGRRAESAYVRAAYRAAPARG